MLTAAEVARQLGISARTVYALGLPCYRFGRAVRFDPADVEAYRVAHQAAPRRPLLKPRELREYMRLRSLAISAGANPDELSSLSPEEESAVSARHRHMRMPPWANAAAIKSIYASAKRLSRETGIPHHVDHIVPLQGDHVSGLHVESNLQVIPATDNIRKRNKVDPC